MSKGARHINTAVRLVYKTLRSILFSAALFVVGVYVLAYILLSIPAFTQSMKEIAEEQLSALTGGTVEIGSLNVYPFSEVKVEGLRVLDPSGGHVLEIETVGAGISIWKFLSQGRIEITYGEIIGLNAEIVQEEKDGPLNIQFLLDAFAPKEKKEPTPFELALRNVVLRKSSASFYRPWLHKNIGRLDLSNLRIVDLAADIAFPKISDKGVEVDLRRLSFNMPDITTVERLRLKGEFGKKGIEIDDLLVELPASRIYMPKVSLPVEEGGSLAEAIKKNRHLLEITESFITPSDFSFLYPPLERLTEALPLNISAEGNPYEIEVNDFSFGRPDLLYLSLKGGAEGFPALRDARGDISNLSLQVSSSLIHRLVPAISEIPEKVREILMRLGDFSLTGDLSASMGGSLIAGNLDLLSDLFDITVEGGVESPAKETFKGDVEVDIKSLRLHHILPEVPVGNIVANVVAEGSIQGRDPQGSLALVVDNFEYKGERYDGLSLNIAKEGENISGDLLVDNAIADITAVFRGDIEGEEKSLGLDMDIARLSLSEVVDMKAYNGYVISGAINIDAEGTGVDNLEGDLSLENFSFASPGSSRALHLKELKAQAGVADSVRSINLRSDWFNFRAEGDFRLKDLPEQMKRLAASVFPSLVRVPHERKEIFASDMDFDLVIRHNNALPEFFNLPVRLLVPITLSGSIQGTSNTANIELNVPYLQQGKDKLIYDSRVVADIDGNSGALNGLIETTMPVKHGDLALNVNLFGSRNTLSTDLHWINTENQDFKGHLALDTSFARNELTSKPEIRLDILPSILKMGTTDWHVSKSSIAYTDKRVTIDNLLIRHGDQFVDINGVASPEYADEVKVSLADIDVDYVFDMLQINYVTFGGTATGEIAGHALLSGNPVAETESFVIKDFTYNGCPLGTCLATSKWNNEQKEIEIGADISMDGKRIIKGSGGIWLGRDSLCFNIDADKVPVDFIQPFMAVFSSHVGGYATGGIKLYGNFHDIDMTGKIFADSVAVKLDYTNTIYHGSDSVLLYPGRIEIPHFELFDKYGNSALLTGELTHRYFHDPSFTFRLSDANNFLCYDTSAELNPDWYGTLYGTGSALLTGVPGITNISADMTVSHNSAFTFVLNETEYARDYQFLTFSDRRKEEVAKNEEKSLTVADYKAMLKKKAQDEASLSRFGIDIRATVTPSTLFTLVMDPAAGDKITARGRGAMQVKYESDDDEMMMYGKYEIDEGNYNFSLQDIILRDFKIKEGSYIAFNGNPLAADLDISATYRVNTNLSDLDKSFSTDRDLNRTNVPVDAVLSVTGNMEAPDITFDIELPTLTQDVERKVKSIISTDDMMNRQIIYLLALNRFYTPEYMGTQGNGGELAAVASSTISSQLSNILGQLTDKLSVAPSFRSDKGDFSDIEVDVALSSRLLNNRLLINGNFGYRDRSTSSTTFVGDFDVEYLLNRNGNLRLKAYNHFNDQNYYLREALTTQGLGVVFRRDFDDWFNFLKKKKKNGSED